MTHRPWTKRRIRWLAALGCTGAIALAAVPAWHWLSPSTTSSSDAQIDERVFERHKPEMAEASIALEKARKSGSPRAELLALRDYLVTIGLETPPWFEPPLIQRGIDLAQQLGSDASLRAESIYELL